MPGKAWTGEETDYLRKHYKEGNIEELIKALGRNKKAIYRKAFSIGVNKFINKEKPKPKPRPKGSYSIKEDKLQCPPDNWYCLAGWYVENMKEEYKNKMYGVGRALIDYRITIRGKYQ